jgi:oligopeptide/dipeptide ABC transporter ATP-binding protein
VESRLLGMSEVKALYARSLAQPDGQLGADVIGTLQFQFVEWHERRSASQILADMSTRTAARLATIPGRPPDLVNPPKGCKFAPRCAYVQDRCREEEPPLVETTPGHEYRCWFPVGTPEGKEAFERNKREQTVAATALARGS